MVSPTSGAVYHVAFCLLGFPTSDGQGCAYNHSCTIPNLGMEEVPNFQDGASSDIINITPSNGTLSYLTSQSEHLLPIRPYRNFCVAKKKKLDLNFESFPTLLVISPRDGTSSKPRMEKGPTASVPDVLVFNYKL
ncbi:hypothetical protein PPACK8108_LOCUS12284 [Phakopsora pachyrhizi]|uniref:Uncharacterized protein n=1 Tax=Phakopsora pachyrhizi TaxID=170000 RepID=A0AAV0B311_PHAPC|nr:hypothetical protein PPACK8108_LOCUS12284 [Phakopsora pachyrhizi]